MDGSFMGHTLLKKRETETNGHLCPMGKRVDEREQRGNMEGRDEQPQQ